MAESRHGGDVAHISASADPTLRPMHEAACHACLFSAETSCERGNRYLDRSVVVGTVEHQGLAFFRETSTGGQLCRVADPPDSRGACGGGRTRSTCPRLPGPVGSARPRWLQPVSCDRRTPTVIARKSSTGRRTNVRRMRRGGMARCMRSASLAIRRACSSPAQISQGRRSG